MRCPRSRSAAALLLALALCTCTDAPTGPRQVLGRLALAPTYSREAREIARNLSAADLPLNKIFVEVRSADNEVRGTELVDFPLDQQEITLKVDVKLKTSAEQLAAKVELRSGEIPIFSSTTQLVVTPKQTGPAPTEPLIYVGPGAEATDVKVQPDQATIALTGSQQLAMAAFDSKGAPVTDLPVSSWTSSDPTVATVTASGLVRGAEKSGTATITVNALKPLSAAARIHVIGLPSRVAVTGGDGQSGTVGTALTQPFQIQVLSGDGEGVPGVAVSFESATAGGAVGAATATTDAQGFASTTVSLGTTAGAYVFKASVVGAGAGGPAPVTTTATALAAAAATITRVSGDGQTGTAGQLLPAPLVVRVTDSFGNPIGGAAVTWTRLTGTGAIGTPAMTTGADGLASTSYSLGSATGIETIRADVSGLTGVAVTFTLTSAAGAAGSLTETAGDGQAATVNTAVAAPPTVVVKDANGNVVAGVVVTFTAGPNSGAVSAGQTFGQTAKVNTNAAGAAQVDWRLGTLAGPQTLVASVPGIPSAVFGATGVAGAATQLLVARPPSSPTASGAAFTIQPQVQRADQYGNPVLASGVSVAASVPATYSLVGATSANTDATGTATFSNLGITGATGSVALTFTSGNLTVWTTASVNAGTATTIRASVSTQLSGTAGSSVPPTALPAVQVVDGSGNPVPGVDVTFSVAGGTITPFSPALVRTDANGAAGLTSWTLPTSIGTATVTAAVAGLGGSPVVFTATVTAATATQLAVARAPNSPTPSGAAFTTQPLIQRQDQFGNATLTSGATVTASVPVGYSLVGGTSATTDASGMATFSTLGVSGPASLVTITFSSPNVTPATATVTVGAGAAASIAPAPNVPTQIAGQVGTAVATSDLPAVRVLDAAGNPVPSVNVTFTVSGGSIAPGSPAVVATNASGIASLTSWTLPTTAGGATVTAALSAVAGSPVVFTATVTAGAPGSMTTTAGDGETATVNTTVTTPPTVVVTDGSGNVVPGVPVTFTAGPNGGTVSGAGQAFGSSVTVNTDATGTAQVAWRLGTLAGAQSLMASVPGLTAVTFGATAVADVAAQLVLVQAPSSPTPSGAAFTTQPVVQPQDQYGNPVLASGLAVSASVPAGSGYSLAGGTLVTTDGSGTASFANLGVSGPVGPVTITFASGNLTATATTSIAAGAPASIAPNVSTQLSGAAGSAVPTSQLPSVVVLDAARNPVAGVGVTFTVAGGAIVPTSPGVVNTDVTGVAKISSWTLPTTTGTATVTATLTGVSGSPLTFTATVTAALTISGAGTGSGVVTSSPTGVNCQSTAGTTTGTCSFAFAAGASVTLTAKPNAGNAFVAWGGACANAKSSTCTLTMASQQDVSITFAAPYKITVAPAGKGSGQVTSQPGLSPVIDCIIVNGTVSPNGTCSGSYSGGTSVTLTTSVAPGSGDSFVGWNGACTGPSPTCLIPGTAGDVNVVANFVFDACNLSTAYTIGTRVNGTLGSCQFGTGLYRDGYNFTLTGQQFFEIAVTASGFPPESRWMITPPSIWWGVWSTVSGTVAQSYLLPAGSYTFWAANHVAQDYGAYTLFSQNVSSPFFTCGQYGPVRTTFGILNAAMTLSGSACPYTASTGLVTRADPYSIYVPAGKQLTVRVTTTAFVPLIELRDGFSDQFDGALAATTAGSQTPGVLTYAPNGGAWLRIFVAAAPGAAGGGAYGLTIDP